jgi:opacity protein-like surface antigen
MCGVQIPPKKTDFKINNKKLNEMKKILLSFVLIIGLNAFASAQGLYANLNFGYGFALSSQNIPDFYNYTRKASTVGYSRTYEQVNVSLGKGLNLGGTIGYMFNKNVGIDLGLSYLLGGQTKATDLYEDGSSSEYLISAKMFRINPSIVVASGLDKINPYAKMGLVIGSGSVTNEVSDFGTYTSKYIMKSDGGIALGLSSAIGVMIGINDNLSFFTEMNMVNLSYAPTKGEIIEYTVDGVNLLSTLTVSEKEVEFVDSYTEIDGSATSESLPSKALKQKLPFGSFGLNFGIRVNL